MPPDEGLSTRVPASGASSWVAQERERPGRPTWWFILVAVLLGAGVAAAAITLGALREGTTAAEDLGATAGTTFAQVQDLFGADALRVAAGLAAGGTVSATAFATRRFTHSPFAGLVAAAVLAVDPVLILTGQLALPAAFLLFAATAGLALALGGHPAFHWLASLFLGAGIALDPAFVVWCIPVALLLWLRGHIYSAPKHLGRSLMQGLGVPVLLGGAFLVRDRLQGDPTALTCGPTGLDALLLRGLGSYDATVLAVPDPVVWFGGLGLIFGLSAAAILLASRTFRITRSPGRIQIRLADRMPRILGRSVWLLAFALAAWTVPGLWLPLAAIALGLGVHHLMKDAPGFGIAVAVALVGFGVLFLVRFAATASGEATAEDIADALAFFPWASPVGCAGA